MSHWIKVGMLQTSSAKSGFDLWRDTHIPELEHRDQSYDTMWLDLHTGCSLLLANTGGWRQRDIAEYRLFHQSGNGNITDVTEGVFGYVTNTKFNPNASGDRAYIDIERNLTEKVDAILNLA